MTMIDASAWTGLWPFTMSAPATLPALVDRLRRAGIGGAVVSPLNAVLAPEPVTSALALIAEVAAAGDDFPVWIAPVIDPSLPGWERDLDDLLAAGDDRIRAVKLVPNYRGYPVAGDAAIALARRATDAGLAVCIQVRILDERAHHPLMKVPGVPVDGVATLAAAVPDGRFLACGVFQAELAALAGAGNVAAELSSIESGDALANALAVVGPDRLLLGTHAPVYDPAPAVAKVAVAGSDLRERAGAANARSVFALVP